MRSQVCSKCRFHGDGTCRGNRRQWTPLSARPCRSQAKCSLQTGYRPSFQHRSSSLLRSWVCTNASRQSSGCSRLRFTLLPARWVEGDEMSKFSPASLVFASLLSLALSCAPNPAFAQHGGRGSHGAAPMEAALTVADHTAVATSTAAEAVTAPMVAVDSTEAVRTAVAISTPVAGDIAPAVVAVSEAEETPKPEILVARCQVANRRKVPARVQLRPTSITRRVSRHLRPWKRTIRAPIFPGGVRLEIVPILLPSQRADHRLSPITHNGTRLETAAILLSRLRVAR